MAETFAVIAAATGVGLVYAAITNQNPVSEVRAALSTGDTSGRTPIDASVTGGAGSAGPPAATTGSTAVGDPSNLVSIGQGSHRLEARAAVAFAHWQRLFGRQISITDSFRSVAQQTAAYDSDPTRFARPGNSAHGEGRAVDVNLRAIGANPQGANPANWVNDPVFRLLVSTAAIAGWCNYQVRNNSTGGRTSEPWHFSYGACK